MDFEVGDIIMASDSNHDFDYSYDYRYQYAIILNKRDKLYDIYFLEANKIVYNVESSCIFLECSRKINV